MGRGIRLSSRLVQRQFIAADGTAASHSIHLGHGIFKILHLSITSNQTDLAEGYAYFTKKGQSGGYDDYYFLSGYCKRYHPVRLEAPFFIVGPGTIHIKSNHPSGHQGVAEITYYKIYEGLSIRPMEVI